LERVKSFFTNDRTQISKFSFYRRFYFSNCTTITCIFTVLLFVKKDVQIPSYIVIIIIRFTILKRARERKIKKEQIDILTFRAVVQNKIIM